MNKGIRCFKFVKIIQFLKKIYEEYGGLGTNDGIESRSMSSFVAHEKITNRVFVFFFTKFNAFLA